MSLAVATKDSDDTEAPSEAPSDVPSDVDVITEALEPALKTPTGANVVVQNAGTPQAVTNDPKLQLVASFKGGSFKFSKIDPKTGLMMEYSGVGTIVDATCAFQSVAAQNRQEKLVVEVNKTTMWSDNHVVLERFAYVPAKAFSFSLSDCRPASPPADS
ncbi:MAG: hypothetical protein SGILL_004267 [Bacillariaceae sp.]